MARSTSASTHLPSVGRRRAKPAAEEIFVIRPRPLKGALRLLPAVMLMAGWLATGFGRSFREQLPWGVVTLLAVVWGAAATVWRTRIVVTANELRLQNGGRTRHLQLSEVATIHRHTLSISLRDQHGRRLARIDPSYTRAQLRALAAQIRVPFIDHTSSW